VTDDATSALGVYYHNRPSGALHGTIRALVLPKPAGVTGVQAGVLQRVPDSPVSPVLAPNTGTEYEHALAFAAGQPFGKCFYFEHRPQMGSAALSQTNKAIVCLGPSQFKSR
jgi:hypothetical protein